MTAAILLRLSSHALQLSMGSFAVFCLYYAGTIPDPLVAAQLVLEAVKFGGLATVIVYCHEKYLFNV